MNERGARRERYRYIRCAEELREVGLIGTPRLLPIIAREKDRQQVAVMLAQDGLNVVMDSGWERASGGRERYLQA